MKEERARGFPAGQRMWKGVAMITIPDLWMPILAASVFVFILSSILHMLFKYHHSDFRPLPNESATLEKLRALALTPGFYNFPYCADHKDMNKPEMQEKLAKGPVGMMTVVPNGPPAMGKLLGLWFAYTVVISIFVAYIAGRTLAPGADYMAVFRFTGTVAFMAYGLANLSNSIWKGAPFKATFKEIFDGLLYSLVTAGAFGWLWPGGN